MEDQEYVENTFILQRNRMPTEKMATTKGGDVEISAFSLTESAPAQINRASLEEDITSILGALYSNETEPERKSLFQTLMEMDGPSPIREEQPQLLNNLGIVVAKNLTEEKIAELEASGIAVTPSEIVTLLFPTARAAAPSLDTWHLDKINIRAARNKNLTGNGICVGILDTGIDAAHPEFANKNIEFAEFDGNGNLVGNNARDAGDHGTHVCGLSAGVNCGVAPEADLAVAAVLTLNGGRSGSTHQILAGLNWLLTPAPNRGENRSRCDVINASLGGNGYNDYLYNTLFTALMLEQVAMIAAIGNSGPQKDRMGSPGNYDIVVGVGATDRYDNPAYFSSWGNVLEHNGRPKPDMAAPGHHITSAQPGGGYQSMSGTSMASPIAAGAAALILESRGNLLDNAAGLQQTLLTLLDNTYQGPRTGGGRLDLSRI